MTMTDAHSGELERLIDELESLRAEMVQLSDQTIADGSPLTPGIDRADAICSTISRSDGMICVHCINDSPSSAFPPSVGLNRMSWGHRRGTAHLAPGAGSSVGANQRSSGRTGTGPWESPAGQARQSAVRPHPAARPDSHHADHVERSRRRLPRRPRTVAAERRLV